MKKLFKLTTIILIVFGCKSKTENTKEVIINKVELHTAISFSEANKNGLQTKNLDKTYKSGPLVFSGENEEQPYLDAYTNFLKNFGIFLNQHNFIWKKSTSCFNRVYFSADGTVDYFLFNFSSKIENQDEFERLLNLYIKDNKIDVTASSNFSQCGNTVYEPE